jgi:mannose-1-phosphate guanylyltransferase/phosphomannomutase
MLLFPAAFGVFCRGQCVIQAVFLLGGKGTRLGLRDRPKPMVDVHGIPLLKRMTTLLAEQGVREFVFLVQHLADVIRDEFAELPGLSITFIEEEEPRGTAGAILDAGLHLQDDFIVVYGDILFDIDVARFVANARKRDGIGTLIVHPNDHPHDSDLVCIDGNGRISAFHNKPHSPDRMTRNIVNAGIYYLRREVLSLVPPGSGICDWGRDVFPAAIRDGFPMHAYLSTEYIKDIGTPERLAQGEKALVSGRVERRSYRNRQKAIFIDRDGVINREIDGVHRKEDMVLLPGVAQALARLNQSEWLTIVVTNQPSLAKGFMDAGTLDQIHSRMDMDLGAEGAFVDDLYYCPHHPEVGWPGEVEELKISCDCRKPQAGMLKAAAEAHNIDLSASFMIGDRDADMLAGQEAGCRTILVPTNGVTWLGDANASTVDKVSDTLKSALDLIFSENPNT